MKLARQSLLLSYCTVIVVAAVLLTTGWALARVETQDRQIEKAEQIARAVTHFRYLIISSAFYPEQGALGQWRSQVAQFEQLLKQYDATPKHAILVRRERENVEVVARLFERLDQLKPEPGRPLSSDPRDVELRAATVSGLNVTTLEMIETSFELIRLSRKELQSAQRLAVGLVLWDVVALALLVAGSVLILRRGVLVPIASLQANTAAVASGRLDVRLNMRQQNEVGDLAKSFDTMTASLQRASEAMLLENAERQRAQDSLQKTVLELAEKTAELTQTRSDLQHIMDHMPALVVYWDTELRNRFANQAYDEWFGVAPQDMHGRHIREIIGGERFEVIEPMLRSVLAGNSEVFERPVPMSDGSVRDALFSYFPDVRDGVVKGLYGFVSDVSKIKQAQAAESEALALVRGVLDAARDFAIIATGLDGTITLFSSGAERMLGYSAVDMIGRASLAQFHDPQELAERGGQLSARDGGAITGFEVLVAATRDGQSESRDWIYRSVAGADIAVNLTVTAVLAADGSAIGYLGIAKDIGKEKLYIAELAAARDAAEMASKTKSRFLANMSHEIRTPMNGVLGMLQLLHAMDMPARQHDYIGRTMTAARTLLGLLNDILDFSKAEAEKIALELAPFELRSLCQDLHNVAAPLAAAQGLSLVLAVEPGLPEVLCGDVHRLRQVLLNLLGNAIKFTSSGVVSLAIRRASSHDGALFEFSVSDTGIGIEAGQLESNFDAFSQAEASMTRRFGGTGLGLAISRELISLMHGRLQVDSLPGRGSRFSFTIALPNVGPSAPGIELHLPGATAAGPAPAERRSRLSGLRLLVVDDQDLNRLVACELLYYEGATVEAASGGTEALAMLLGAQVPFDLVLMDVQMPDQDGHETTRQMRTYPQLAHLPVVAVTANAMAGDHEACLAAGMNGYEEKPIDLDRIVATILQHCRPLPEVPAPLVLAAPNIAAQEALRRLGGNVDLYRRLVQRLGPDAALQVDALAAALAAGDLALAGNAAHSLSGIASAVGAVSLAAAARDLEQAAHKGGPVPDSGAVRQKLQSLLDASLTELGRLMGSPVLQPAALSAVPAVQPSTQAQLIDQLAPLLAAKNMAALDVFAQLQRGPGGGHAAMRKLSASIMQLDFNQALECLPSLKAAIA